MKKVVIAVMVAASAILANGAVIKWNFEGFEAAPGHTGTFEGYTAYLVDAAVVSMADMVAALNGADTGKLSGALKSNVIDDGNYPIVEEGEIGNVTSGTYYEMYTVILNPDEDHYLITDSVTKVAPSSGKLTMRFDDGDKYSWNAMTLTPTPGPTDIPEPTSGLLIIVGGALLALRRKQK